jgi:hypothetical protein
LKVAFDENVPSAMVRMFQILADERQLKGLSSGLIVESATDYTPKPGEDDHRSKDDVPWISRFAAAGGRVIISGDTQMKAKPHERLALVQAGLVTIFFEAQWSNWRFFKKCSLLLHWWPEVAKTARSADPGTFWHVPCHWQEGSLRQVSNQDQKLIKAERRLRERAVVRARRPKPVIGSQSSFAFVEPQDDKV